MDESGFLQIMFQCSKFSTEALPTFQQSLLTPTDRIRPSPTVFTLSSCSRSQINMEIGMQKMLREASDTTDSAFNGSSSTQLILAPSEQL